MSSFMVEDATINRVLTYLDNSESRRTYLHLLAQDGFDVTRPDWLHELGRQMAQLNARAITERYGDGDMDDYVADTKAAADAYQPGTELAGKVAVYKSLKCWLYQCAEGDADATSLYKFFRRTVEQFLANEIISELPAYAKAPWG